MSGSFSCNKVPTLPHTGSGLKQHVSRGGTCNLMHLAHENKTKIKLSPPRLEGTPALQRDSEEPCPSCLTVAIHSSRIPLGSLCH